MHYGIGPEVFASYRRHELNKAAPLREPFGKSGHYDKFGGTDDTHRTRAWIGRLLISAGEHLAGQLRGRRNTRRVA